MHPAKFPASLELQRRLITRGPQRASVGPGTHGRDWPMSASALLASNIMTTFVLAGLAFVASRKGYQVLAALLAAVVWLFIALNYLLWRWSQ